MGGRRDGCVCDWRDRCTVCVFSNGAPGQGNARHRRQPGFARVVGNQCDRSPQVCVDYWGDLRDGVGCSVLVVVAFGPGDPHVSCGGGVWCCGDRSVHESSADVFGRVVVRDRPVALHEMVHLGSVGRVSAVVAVHRDLCAAARATPALSGGSLGGEGGAQPRHVDRAGAGAGDWLGDRSWPVDFCARLCGLPFDGLDARAGHHGDFFIARSACAYVWAGVAVCDRVRRYRRRCVQPPRRRPTLAVAARAARVGVSRGPSGGRNRDPGDAPQRAVPRAGNVRLRRAFELPVLPGVVHVWQHRGRSARAAADPVVSRGEHQHRALLRNARVRLRHGSLRGRPEPQPAGAAVARALGLPDRLGDQRNIDQRDQNVRILLGSLHRGVRRRPGRRGVHCRRSKLLRANLLAHLCRADRDRCRPRAMERPARGDRPYRHPVLHHRQFDHLLAATLFRGAGDRDRRWADADGSCARAARHGPLVPACSHAHRQGRACGAHANAGAAPRQPGTFDESRGARPNRALRWSGGRRGRYPSSPRPPASPG